MNENLQALLLLASLFTLLLSGFGTIFIGSGGAVGSGGSDGTAGGGRANAIWLVWSGFALFACDLIVNGRELLDSGGRALNWSRGWMLPHDQVAALTVGLSVDPLNLAFCVFILVAAVLFMIVERPGRLIHGALAIGVAGSALAWFATTPWLAFIGIGMANLGGFIALCSDRGAASGAGLAARFGWQRFSGLSLALLGAGSLAGTRGALVVGGLFSGTDTAAGGAWNLGSGSEVLGAWLLALGLFVQFQAFPFVGWSMSASRMRVAHRALLTLILPGSAALSFLLKLEPQLRQTELVPWLAWAAVGSAALTLLSGLFNPRRESALCAWISAAFALSLAASLRAGPASGIALAVASLLPAFALSLLLEAPSRHWIERVAAVLVGASGAGFIGFVSAGGWFEWLARDGFIVAALFLQSLLGWILAWDGVIRAGESDPKRSPWAAGLSAIFVTLLSCGLLWTGTLSGGALQAEGDQIFPSFTRLMFSAQAMAGTDPSTLNVIYGLTFVAALGLAIWLPLERVRKAVPGAKFVAEGYRLDRVATAVRDALRAVGRALTTVSEDKVWKTYLPEGLLYVLRALGELAVRMSDGISRGISVALERGVAGPTRVLQLVQSGDVQWYLFLAAGSGLVLLLHFLRT